MTNAPQATPSPAEDHADHGKKRRLSVALAGNPNSGKTTIFNAITGARQRVGNYPGVTVEKKEGAARAAGQHLHVLDLPGTYSLTAYSQEEIIARNVLIDQTPDVVIDIIDSSNLERNLYLATQLLELSVPLVLAFNMTDVADGRGFNIDVDGLSGLLGVPIVRTVGHKGKGVDELVAKAVEVGLSGDQAVARQRYPDYGHEIEPHVKELTELLGDAGAPAHRTRWFAVKLLENDQQTIERVRHVCGERAEPALTRAGELRSHIERIFGDASEIILADRRYGFISGACLESVVSSVEARHDVSDKIDAVMTNRVLGMPIFLALMFGMFYLTFALGQPLMDLISAGQNWLAVTIGHAWAPAHAPLLRSLVINGIIYGVGAVLVFLPIILLLFLAIALLEDTGYMARAAFIMDRVMHKLGLHGKSFIPMLIGFGCSVPAIMATRTLESRRDRLTTMLVIPLMSCGARMPIYALFIPAFFAPKWRPHMLLLIYLIGIALAIVCAKLLRSTVLRGEPTPFVMELPPYRTPTIKGLLIHMWERSWQYVKKAGTIILLVTIIMWAMSTFPRDAARQQQYETDVAQLRAHYGHNTLPRDGQREQHQADGEQVRARYGDLPDERQAALDRELGAMLSSKNADDVQYSVVGRLGRLIEPVVKPMGFDWRIGTALVGALAAKEVFVSQLGVVYALGEGDESDQTLQSRLNADYSPLVGFCVMLFALITAPCVATIAITRQESNSWRWALLQLFGLTILAYVVTTVVYQIGRLFT